MNTSDALAAYKAQVDAKYAAMKNHHFPTEAEVEEEIRNRPPDWLLISPDHIIDGVASGRHYSTAFQAFDLFYPTKKSREIAVRDGWIVVRDTPTHRWFDAFALGWKEKRPVVWEE